MGRRGGACAARESRAPTSTTSRWARCSRAAATSLATPRSNSASPNVPGVAYNRHCASGMAPVQSGAASIMAGMDDVVIAGGAESISSSPSAMKRIMGTDEMAPWMSPSHRETPDAPGLDMSITVGHNTASAIGISREDMDEWAYRSHLRAVAAIDEGRLQEEIFPVEVTRRDGSTTTFAVDEHPRRETSLEKLGELEAAASRDRRLRDHRGELVGPERRRVRARARGSRLRRRARPDAAGSHRLLGVDRAPAARHRPRTDPRDPEGARRARA